MGSVINYLLENYGAIGAMVIVMGTIAWIILKELRESNKRLIKTQMDINTQMSNSLTESLAQMTNKLTESIQQQNDKLLNHVLDANKQAHRQAHMDNLDERMDITPQVHHKLEEITLELHASRGLIIEFHNSFENYSGLPFAKYTATDEYPSKGCLPIQHKINALQYSTIHEVVRRITHKDNDDHIVIAKELKDLYELAPALADMIQETSDAILWKGLFDANNHNILGLLAFEFKKGLPDEIDIESIKIAASSISQLLTLKKKK